MSKTVLVTGASRGIGRATALRLGQDGYDVVVHYNKSQAEAETLCETLRALGRSARLLQFDISMREQVNAVLEADIQAHGAYYGVVLNAGINKDAAFPALSDQDWDDVLRTNLDGFYNVLKPLVMPMVRRQSPGRIVTLASISGIAGNRGQVNYSAAKGGIIAASKALALELAKREITVNCVAPGLIDTDMTSELAQSELKKLIPLRRFGKADEVASLISYLMSEGAAYITRQVIAIDGGFCP